MTRAFVFPGQGSQVIGMGADLAKNFTVAKEVFEEVDDALSQNLFKLMTEGDASELTLTQNAQPAIMAVSMAVMKTLEKEGNLKLGDVASFVAGHSLGEYSALCAAGVFSLSDTAKLLKTRGEAMQKAVPVGVGSMAAVMGISLEKAKELAAKAAENEVCVAANDNADGQVVLSGHMGAIDRAVELASEFGAKRCVKLPVSAPFHSPLMEPAARVMEEALANVDAKAPIVPVVANVIAEKTSDVDEIKSLLVKQVTGSVRWRESVLYMKEQGVDTLVELGSGKVLSGLLRRIDRSMSAKPINNEKDIEAFLSSL
jgi:[acyl-carrier-protein] S-malonyltransferase